RRRVVRAALLGGAGGAGRDPAGGLVGGADVPRSPTGAGGDAGADGGGRPRGLQPRAGQPAAAAELPHPGPHRAAGPPDRLVQPLTLSPPLPSVGEGVGGCGEDSRAWTFASSTWTKASPGSRGSRRPRASCR